MSFCGSTLIKLMSWFHPKFHPKFHPDVLFRYARHAICDDFVMIFTRGCHESVLVGSTGRSTGSQLPPGDQRKDDASTLHCHLDLYRICWIYWMVGVRVEFDFGI